MSDLEKQVSSDIVAASTYGHEKRGLSDQAQRIPTGGPPPFRWASLWEPAVLNPLNGKSYTLPIFRLTDQYAINFHRAPVSLPRPGRLLTRSLTRSRMARLLRRISLVVCAKTFLCLVPSWPSPSSSLSPPALCSPFFHALHFITCSAGELALTSLNVQAFPPLIPEAIKTDLKLTNEQVRPEPCLRTSPRLSIRLCDTHRALRRRQIGNSNIVALLATLVARFALGPLVDRFGPRYTMAAILVAGAIPSGLAGAITNVSGLYAVSYTHLTLPTIYSV